MEGLNVQTYSKKLAVVFREDAQWRESRNLTSLSGGDRCVICIGSCLNELIAEKKRMMYKLILLTVKKFAEKIRFCIFPH